MERNRKQKGMGNIDKGIACMGILILLVAGIGVASATPITVPSGDSIQDAINNLPAEGGVIELLPGVHDVFDTIYINKSHVTIHGTHDSEIRSLNSSNDVFRVNLNRTTQLENITFDGFSVTSSYANEGQSNVLIKTDKVDNLIIKNINDTSWIIGFVNINWRNPYYSTSDGLWILNNTIQHSAMSIILATNMEIAYNYMSGYTGDYGMYLEGGNTGMSVHDNYLENNGAIQTESVSAHIFNNTCIGGKMGITARYNTPNILIESNTITGMSIAGIQFYSCAGLVNQTARNNIIYDCPGDGIQIAEIAWATATGTSDVTLQNNVIYNCGGDGIGRGPKTESMWILNITNNIITNNTGYGINLAHELITETHSYNDIWGNTQGSYNNASAGIGDIAVNLLFADSANGDFHLKSTAGRWSESGWVYTDTEDSPCIDAGNPASDYFNEPDYPLGHINMGAYGNTEEASKGAPTGPDTTSPTMTTHSPTGTSVLVDTNISVTFSEAMDEPSAEAAFSVDGVTGAFTWAGNKMVFTPIFNLDYETTYTATISTPAKDLAGNPLDSSYFYNFTTVSSGGCYTYKLVNPGESIQDTIDSLCFEGGTIELGAGIHDVYDTIVISRSNVTIQGTHNSEIRSHNSSADIFSIPYKNPQHTDLWNTMPMLENLLFKGFKVTSTYGFVSWNYATVHAYNVDNITIEGVLDQSSVAHSTLIHISGYGGPAVSGGSKNIFIKNNNVTHATLAKVAFSENVHVINNTGNFIDAVNRNVKYAYITGNHISGRGSSAAIRLHAGQHVLVSNNTCVGGGFGIYNDGVSDLIIEHNTIRDVISTGKEHNCGVLIYPQGGISNVTIRNNRIHHNNAHGIQTAHYDYGFSGYGSNTDIINNVIYDNTGDSILMTSEYVQMNIINNIITNNGGYGINYMETIEPTIISYNDVWNNALGNYISISAGKEDISEDPLFVNPEDGNFHLKSTAKGWPDSSPCIDTGVPYEEDPVFGVYVNEPVPNGGRVNIGAYGNTAEASLSHGTAPSPGTDYIWLEAESADTLTPDFETANDASASNGEYIWVPEGVGFRASDGEATYTIHINSSGDYVLWGTTLAPTGGDNSFFVQMDEGSEALWTINLSGTWHWDAVNHWGTGTEFNPEIDPVVFTLAAGEHTLRIKQREDGTKLDRLLITNNMSYVPAEIESTNAISGTVTSPCGTIIPNATVTLTTRAGAEINTTQTDSTGHYAFANVSPDYYDITATKRSYWSNTNNVTVTADEPETADIVLCQKGDLNTNSEPADAGDLAMMADATEAGTSDETYDLDGDGNPADAADLTLLKDVSVGVAELE